jgi:hypothetical protein
MLGHDSVFTLGSGPRKKLERRSPLVLQFSRSLDRTAEVIEHIRSSRCYGDNELLLRRSYSAEEAGGDRVVLQGTPHFPAYYSVGRRI